MAGPRNEVQAAREPMRQHVDTTMMRRARPLLEALLADLEKLLHDHGQLQALADEMHTAGLDFSPPDGMTTTAYREYLLPTLGLLVEFQHRLGRLRAEARSQA